MIGNDIIDLQLARKQSNWQRKGFLEKIFTLGEQQAILQAADPEIMVWAYWSRKEAAYKIFNRKTRIRIYNPLQFECSLMEFANGIYHGKVINGNNIYYSETQITTDFIYSIVTENHNDLMQIYDCDDSIAVTKIGNIPFNEFMKPLSISHHGKFKRIISIN